MASPEISTQFPQEQQKTARGKSFQNILDFLAEATPTLSYLRTPWPPRHKNQTETYWQRNFTIAGRYFGTDTTLEQIGKDYHTTRERIRQIVKAVVKTLHQNSRQETQMLHPINSFDFDKSRTLEGRKRKSQKSGGKSFMVAELISQGKSGPEISIDLSINAIELFNIRRTLRG